MSVKTEVRVEGLADVRRALKQFSADAEKEFREELKNSSVMYRIAANASTRIRTETGRNTKRPSRSTGRAAGSIRVLSDSRAVWLVGGKKSVPYYAWLDFGGELKPTGRRHNRQTRPFMRRGRALYPAIDMHVPEIRDVAREAMADARQKAGLHG